VGSAIPIGVDDLSITSTSGPAMLPIGDADQLDDPATSRVSASLCTFPIELESRLWKKGCQQWSSLQRGAGSPVFDDADDLNHLDVGV
jgi:hypothetical protein